MAKLKVGKVLAFAGISGCGKSTLARSLAPLLGAQLLSEPEVDSWPAIARDQAHYGPALALFAFRQLWAAYFIDADRLRGTGQIAILDSYFFKTNGAYLGLPGMDWLLPATDPYLTVFQAMTQLDEQYFPDVDGVILLDISAVDRTRMLTARGRDSDRLAGFSENYALERQYVRQATFDHCRRYQIPVLEFQHHFGEPVTQAAELAKLLKQHWSL